MNATNFNPNGAITSDCFIRFKAEMHGIPLPERFTFPFQYSPHPLCVQAATELQQYLKNQTQWTHNFGINPEDQRDVYGKMFGVLVVQNEQHEIGYLAAFSGKLAGENHHPGFVPPVFDLLEETGFYRKEEAVLSEINRKIEALEQNPQLPQLLELLQQETMAFETQLEALKQVSKVGKGQRKAIREAQISMMSPEAFNELEARLVQESLQEHYQLKDLKRKGKERIEALQIQVLPLMQEIQTLKEIRRKKSAALQQHIFDHYFFLNQAGTQKSLADIFQKNAATPPPAGAGECAAPKLLQYAFLYQLKPIAMAEFWWGQSPVGEIRKHGHFYPACRGKCEPILGHMLEGIALDDNPMSQDPSKEFSLEILFEDEHLLVVHKPPGLLSVPGKSQMDSVYFRMKQRFTDATGPLMVHRLDMGTSGLMLVAKNAEIHKHLQQQFIRHTIKKRYVADLEGELQADSGIIDLPLRVDLEDRPRQMVCYTYGKSARTEWQVVARAPGRTRVYFYPITGRTHQLRVHAAHPRGLNAPISGDELYGTHGERLHLHADRIEFIHPISGEVMVFQKDPAF